MSGSGLFISLFRHHIGPLFVNDLSVTQQVARVAPICAAYQVFDGIAGTSSGVLRWGMPSTSAKSAAFVMHSAVCSADIDHSAIVFQQSHRLQACASAVLNDALVKCFGYICLPAGTSHAG